MKEMKNIRDRRAWDGNGRQELLKIIRLITAATCVLFLSATAGLSSAPAKKEKDRDSVSIEERIQILSEELEKVKLKKAVKIYKSSEGLGPAASGVYNVEDGFSIGGYGELIFTDYKSNFKKDKANTKRLILYAGYKFTDKIVLNTEIEYENAGFERKSYISEVDFANQKTKSSGNNSGEVFVEFAYVDFLLKDWAKIAVGLQLVPIGITSYMHEPTTFNSVNRPETEKSIIPTTWREMGAVLHGDIPGDFTYRIGMLTTPAAQKFNSGSFIRKGREKGSKASMEDWAYVVNLEYKGIKRLMVGGTIYSGESDHSKIAAVDWKARVNDPLQTAPSSDLLNEYSSYQGAKNKNGTVRVNIAEVHFTYEYGPFLAKGLFSRGWLNEKDTRTVNRETGKNIGMVVEGGYLEIGFNILSMMRTEQKLVLFVRSEMLNTQKETVRRYYGGKEDIVDAICASALNNTCATASNKQLGIINASDSGKELYGVKGVADGVNDRRIITTGLAYFPIPNVVLKVDYEKWNSKVAYPYGLEWKNTSNNKIDKLNFAVGFIF